MPKREAQFHRKKHTAISTADSVRTQRSKTHTKHHTESGVCVDGCGKKRWNQLTAISHMSKTKYFSNQRNVLAFSFEWMPYILGYNTFDTSTTSAFRFRDTNAIYHTTNMFHTVQFRVVQGCKITRMCRDVKATTKHTELISSRFFFSDHFNERWWLSRMMSNFSIFIFFSILLTHQ